MASRGNSQKHQGIQPLYDETISRIQKLCELWEPRLDLPGIVVEHRYLDTYEEDHWTVATTEADWMYRQARVCWWLPSVIKCDDEKLEKVVVHEYVHVLLGVLDNRFKPSSDEHVEAATENLTRALLSVAKRT